MLNLKAKAIAFGLGILAFAGAILTAFLKGRKSKAIEVQAKTADHIIKDAETSREIHDEITGLSNSDLDDRLLNDARNPD